MTLPTGYALRPATPADAELIQAQRDAMFTDMGRDEAVLALVSPDALAWVRSALERGEYGGVLLQCGGEVVGGAGVLWQSFPPSPVTSCTTRAYILNVYVRPPHRGHGLARTMVAALLEQCRERGVTAVTLHASEAGRPSYERLGFAASSDEMRLRLQLQEAG